MSLLVIRKLSHQVARLYVLLHLKIWTKFWTKVCVFVPYVVLSLCSIGRQLTNITWCTYVIINVWCLPVLDTDLFLDCSVSDAVCLSWYFFLLLVIFYFIVNDCLASHFVLGLKVWTISKVFSLFNNPNHVSLWSGPRPLSSMVCCMVWKRYNTCKCSSDQTGKSKMLVQTTFGLKWVKLWKFTSEVHVIFSQQTQSMTC